MGAHSLAEAPKGAHWDGLREEARNFRSTQNVRVLGVVHVVHVVRVVLVLVRSPSASLVVDAEALGSVEGSRVYLDVASAGRTDTDRKAPLRVSHNEDTDS